MADYHRSDSLEDELREIQRLAAIHRRRKRIRWLIPLCLLVILLAAGIVWLVRHSAPKQEPETETVVSDDAVVRLAFLGDITLNDDMIRSFRTPEGYDFSPCFQWVTADLQAANLTIGNLEGNITDPDAVGDYNYPAALLDALYLTGVDVLQTANSCSIQNGITGLVRTSQEITAAGMAPVGTCESPEQWSETGSVLIREVNGIRFAFVAFTKGLNNLRLPEGSEYCVNLLYEDYDTNYKSIAEAGIVRVLDRAKASSPDVIVALVHWGSEYTEEIADSQRQIAQLMLENGVSLIVGTHSHCVGPIETGESIQTGRYAVAYGLGDFLSVSEGDSFRSGCILNVSYEKHEERVTMSGISYSPTFSAYPSEDLESDSYEVLDSLQAVSHYRENYYIRVSKPLYEKLLEDLARIDELTGAPELREKK